ncbi:glutamate-5-semialdehyde dehydrogenase [Anaerofustis stercorihominis]|uniref:glutamate-5-semialdehyde dehydrogenase n=1 Tax=Anaerofustis stercorihominis TaxID=214853 RepID=UPI00214C7A5C|nr:glutamate-5-semialdehyde dehydrogenase [Anaerofustis stercorihominis]MCR2033092.1 glutamate-5-semialdehyde dehydrogenase [Anaerofustis stercorihominis]
MFNMNSLGKKAKIAGRSISDLNTNKKNEALECIKNELISNMKSIIKANKEDIINAKANGMKESMIDRLTLDEDRIKAIANSIDKVINLKDPVGIISGGSKRPNGMEIVIKRVPYGVVGIIFESRPNVTVDAGCLCLKSGNACILRGGKEAINTNTRLVEVMRGAVKKAGLNHDVIQLVSDTDRKYVSEMAKLTEYIDVLIPRGSAGLIRSIKDIATVPFIETGAGNCHIYIDEFADNDMAVDLTDNGKTQRPSVCNSLETLLIHEKKAEEVLPLIYSKLKEHNVEFRGDERTVKILGSKAKKATEEDYKTEYNDYIIAVKIVENIEEAINHINKYSTKHSECIVTNNIESMNLFTSKIDSACVYVNVSTRFTDGEEFGFGSEIGIATQRTLPRGPMGLNELTTIKYVITGSGQIR